MNFFDVAGIKDTDSFFAELDREFYRKFPEEWGKGEQTIKHLGYTKIIQGNQDYYIRQRGENEKSTPSYIGVDGYHIWEVGRYYIVKYHDFNMRDVEMSSQTLQDNVNSEEHTITINQDGTIGKLKLIRIEVSEEDDKLIFEVVEDG